MQKEVRIAGDRVARRRLHMGMNQSELAQKIYVSQNSISAYERGLTDPSVDTLYLMANVLSVSVDWLLGLTEYPEQIVVETMTDDERDLLAEYRALGDDNKQRLRQILNVLNWEKTHG